MFKHNKISIRPLKHGTLRGKILRGLMPLTLGSLLVLGIASSIITFQTKKQDVFEISEKLLNYTSTNVERLISKHASNFWIDVNADSLDAISRESMQSMLTKLSQSGDGLLESIQFINLKGKVVAESTGDSKYLLLEYIPSAIRTASSNKVYISTVEYISGKPYVRIGAPLTNKQNQAVGIVTGVLSLKEVQDTISDKVIGNHGYLVLLDTKNQILSSGNKNDYISEKYYNQSIISHIGKSNTTSRLQKNYLDQYVVASAQRIKSLNWIVISEWPAVDAFSVMFAVVGQIILILLGAGLFIYIFSFVIADRIVSPIEKLREAAIILGQGKFHQKINFNTNDELDDLIESFNTMSGELERLIAEIVKKQETIAKQKDEFVFIAAHELRAPVTAVRWVLDDVINNPGRRNENETIEYLKKAFQANERLVQLVQDLLEVARSDAGKVKLVIEKVEISKAVDNSIAELEVLAKEKDHKIHYQQIRDEFVLADPGKLSEVLNNLISNAIKYTPSGGEIDIWHEKKNQTIITYIKDNGFGISPENQRQLFSKFFRVESENTKDIQGTGLGLFITKELVERMGGKISINSKIGLGSVFSFSLPIGDSAQEKIISD